MPAVEGLVFVSRTEALDRFRALFRDLRTLPDDLGENPFPASLEVSLRADHQSPREVQRLVHDFERAPGVQEVQYDLLWIERLATAVRLVRGVGLFLGGILVLAGVFTISNVIRLTIYAREDELDIMRLVGATQAYVRGPFVVEGMIQGGLGGLVSVRASSWLALRLLTRDLATASEVLGRASISLPRRALGPVLVAGRHGWSAWSAASSASAASGSERASRRVLELVGPALDQHAQVLALQGLDLALDAGRGAWA